ERVLDLTGYTAPVGDVVTVGAGPVSDSREAIRVRSGGGSARCTASDSDRSAVVHVRFERFAERGSVFLRQVDGVVLAVKAEVDRLGRVGSIDIVDESG